MQTEPKLIEGVGELAPPSSRELDDDRESVDNRLWRMQQRQSDALAQLARMESKIDSIVHEHHDRRWRLEKIEELLKSIERKPVGASAIFSDSPIARTIFYGLLAMVGALATGQFLNIVGIFK